MNGSKEALSTKFQYFKERLKRVGIIRAVLKPYMNRKYKIVDSKYAQSDDAALLRSLKDSCRGQRCFIIGNGPSIVVSDLEKLVDEVTFAVNGIYRLFDKTYWRPNFFVCADRNALSLEIENILSMDVNQMFIDVFAKGSVPDDTKNVTFINLHPSHFLSAKFSTENIRFSHDIDKYICSGYTVTYTAIQIAAYMGFSKIYLLGVDHSYSRAINSDGKITEKRKGVDHFFGSERRRGYFYYEGVEYAYALARREAKASGIEILNATRGGYLDIFERVELDEVLRNR